MQIDTESKIVTPKRLSRGGGLRILRSKGEKIILTFDDIYITICMNRVLQSDDGTAREAELVVNAPKHVGIFRDELYRKIMESEEDRKRWNL